jgi:hypothetical protein
MPRRRPGFVVYRVRQILDLRDRGICLLDMLHRQCCAARQNGQSEGPLHGHGGGHRHVRGLMTGQLRYCQPWRGTVDVQIGTAVTSQWQQRGSCGALSGVGRRLVGELGKK